MSDQAVISIQDLHKSYDSHTVLKGVSLNAYKGQVISIIGSSGSGKSTLLRCCNMLEICEAGDIIFEGETIKWHGTGATRQAADAAQVRRLRINLSMVFQSFNLWAHLNVLQNVMEAPVSVLHQSKDEAKVIAHAMLKKVGIADKCDAFPAMLSGGQQQRAAIARALAMQPKAILFDEPTSALDPELEQEVIRVIKQLAAEDRTMIIVTHDMAMAKDISDHVIFLHDGKIEEQGSPKQIFGTPHSKRLQQFLSATPI